jgi:hypothetical protein
MTATVAEIASIIVLIASFAWLIYALYQHYFVWRPKFKAQQERIKQQRAYLDSLTPEKIASMSDEEKEAEVYRLLNIKKEEK